MGGDATRVPADGINVGVCNEPPGTGQSTTSGPQQVASSSCRSSVPSVRNTPDNCSPSASTDRDTSDNTKNGSRTSPLVTSTKETNECDTTNPVTAPSCQCCHCADSYGDADKVGSPGDTSTSSVRIGARSAPVDLHKEREEWRAAFTESMRHEWQEWRAIFESEYHAKDEQNAAINEVKKLQSEVSCLKCQRKKTFQQMVIWAGPSADGNV